MYYVLGKIVKGAEHILLENDAPRNNLEFRTWYIKVQEYLQKHKVAEINQIKRTCFSSGKRNYKRFLVLAVKNGFLNRYLIYSAEEGEKEDGKKPAFIAYTLNKKDYKTGEMYEPDQIKILEFMVVNEFLLETSDLFLDYTLFASNESELIGKVKLKNELELGLWVPKEVDEIDDIDKLEQEIEAYNLSGLIIINPLDNINQIEEWARYLPVEEIFLVDEDSISDIYSINDGVLEQIDLEPENISL